MPKLDTKTLVGVALMFGGVAAVIIGYKKVF